MFNLINIVDDFDATEKSDIMREVSNPPKKHQWKFRKIVLLPLLAFILIIISISMYFNRNVEETIIVASNLVESDFADENYSSNPDKFDNEKFASTKMSSWLFMDDLPQISKDSAKQSQILQAIQFSFKSYKEKCLGFDYFHPIISKCSNDHYLGLTVLESLSTLYSSGQQEFFNDAITRLNTTFSVQTTEFDIYELVISGIGSLLSAYEMSGKQFLLDRAIYYADMILPLINLENGTYCRYAIVSLQQKQYILKPNLESSMKAIPSPFFLEFMKLAELSHDTKYVKYALAGFKTLTNFTFAKEQFSDEFDFNQNKETIIEYIPKLYFITRGRFSEFLEIHQKIINKYYDSGSENTTKYEGSIVTSLISGAFIDNENSTSNLYDAAKIIKDVCKKFPPSDAIESVLPYHYMDGEAFFDHFPHHHHHKHMMGFYPDSIAGGREYFMEEFREQRERSEKARSKAETLKDSGYIFADKEFPVDYAEPLYILWKRTGDPSIRDCAWSFFANIVLRFRVSRGFLDILSKKNEPDEMYDTMNPFLIGETLKFLYLIFSDSNYFSATNYIFNAAGQPFRMISRSEMDKLEPLIKEIISTK